MVNTESEGASKPSNPWWRHPVFLFDIVEGGTKYALNVFWPRLSDGKAVAQPDPVAEEAVRHHREDSESYSSSESNSADELPWELREGTEET